MGFSKDTAVTVDADLTKYFFEQQIAKLLRDGATYTELHKGVVDELIGWLRAKYTTAQITALDSETVDDFKPALAALVLSKIFAGMGGARPQERESAFGKAAYYFEKWTTLRDAVAIKTSDGKVKTLKTLPLVVNTDFGSMFPALGTMRPAQIAATEISDFDTFVIDGK